MRVALTILAGTLGFFLTLALHILIWRLIKPVRQIVWLIIIFLLLPLLGYLSVFVGILIAGSNSLIQATAWLELLFAFIWQLALSLAYIMTYPPIQTGCPTLIIVLAVYRSMPGGLSAGEIRNLFSEHTLFDERKRELKEDGLVQLEDSVWRLTRAGKVISAIFWKYRRLLKLPPGEG